MMLVEGWSQVWRAGDRDQRVEGLRGGLRYREGCWWSGSKEIAWQGHSTEGASPRMVVKDGLIKGRLLAYRNRGRKEEMRVCVCVHARVMATIRHKAGQGEHDHCQVSASNKDNAKDAAQDTGVGQGGPAREAMVHWQGKELWQRGRLNAEIGNNQGIVQAAAQACTCRLLTLAGCSV
eukprot:scaffold188969_cov19-Tisochrysis_lutea.AAC.1